MLSFQVWKIKMNKIVIPENKIDSRISFRHLEKIMLYLAKHIIQWIVLVVVKYWLIFTTKISKWVKEKATPKIRKILGYKVLNENNELVLKRNSFVKRAVLESKAKIRKMKEKIKEEI